MFAGMYMKLIAAAIVVAAVIGAWMYVSHLRTENVNLTAQVTELNSKLKDQNDAISALKKDADARVAAGKIEVDLAKAETAKAKGKARIIYKVKPSTPGDNCKSALDLINGVTQ